MSVINYFEEDGHTVCVQMNPFRVLTRNSILRPCRKSCVGCRVDSRTLTTYTHIHIHINDARSSERELNAENKSEVSGQINK